MTNRHSSQAISLAKAKNHLPNGNNGNIPGKWWRAKRAKRIARLRKPRRKSPPTSNASTRGRDEFGPAG